MAKHPYLEAIRREWDAGQLALTTIASLHGDGITPQAINTRAKRENWPPRLTPSGRVTPVVTPPHAAPESVTDRNVTETSPGVALALFARVMGVLMTERNDLRELNDHYAWLMGKMRAKRTDIDAGSNGVGGVRKPGAMSLREMQMFSTMLKDLAMMKRTMIPLVRRAYGLTDEDGPSELDRLTDEQLAAAEEKLRHVLAQIGIDV